MDRTFRPKTAALAAVVLVAACLGQDPASRATDSRPAVSVETRPGPMRVAPFPEHRYGHRAEVLPDRRVVVFGGFGPDATGDRGMRATWVFDPGKGAWARAGDLNTPMAFHASVMVGGVVHAIGGNVERFDAATRTWAIVIGGKPFVDSHLGAAAAGSRVLLAGGYPDSRPRLAMLDVASKTWEPVPPYPGFHEHDHFSYVAAFDGLFHVAGGFGGAARRGGRVRRYQPGTRRSSPRGRSTPTAGFSSCSGWAETTSMTRGPIRGRPCRSLHGPAIA
jgi:hypothetical protein